MRSLEPTEYRETWDAFYEMFTFRPSVSGPFPGILEPAQSITFRPREQFEEAHLDELRGAIFGAFSVTVGKAAEVYYLDWQHECFAINMGSETTWANGYPDGDYAILLAKDIQSGTFGHPWEPSICLFGDAFVRAVLARRPFILETVIRNRGGYVL